MRYCKLLLGCWLALLAFASQAFEPLPPEQAFAFSTTVVNDHKIVAHWTIAPGYYLYRDQFRFSLVNAAGAKLDTIVLPPGIPKEDAILGKYQVYENAVAIDIPFAKTSLGLLTVAVSYQGCAQAGFCYPPVTKQINFNMPSSAPDKAVQLLMGRHWLLTLMVFFGFGLLLAFTPCILPMIPILSSIIVGQGKIITAWRGFKLSFTYVFAMAVTYAIAGVVAGLAGSYVQAFLQNPWIISLFSLVFVLLALSLFGCYELRLPYRLQHLLTHLSNRQQAGTYIGVGIMGCLSALIVSPCVTAPLIGALSYIGKTGDAKLGGAALFSMGLGMGAPLLVFGTLEGKFLPKAGVWMKWVKIFFGILLLGVAISLLNRVVSFESFMPKAKAVQQSSVFKTIKGIEGFQHALAEAKGKPVMLDFYADWCVSCKRMERSTLHDSEVQQTLKPFVLLRADVTANDEQDRALEKRLGVVAPPTILFFDERGQEIIKRRIVGEVNVKEFLEYLRMPQTHIVEYRE